MKTATTTLTPDAGERNKAFAKLALGALGVVYGDIGTSPLYTLQQTFGEHGIAPTPANVLGVLSLVFWSLVLIVAVKYAGFIMRADNRGEGGIMALSALAQRTMRDRPRIRWMIMILGLFGASLFFGDGVITPAISVLSAVEGLEVAVPQWGHYMVPLAAVIIVALFYFQSHGTGKVGAVFGPIMMAWFTSPSCTILMPIKTDSVLLQQKCCVCQLRQPAMLKTSPIVTTATPWFTNLSRTT